MVSVINSNNDKLFRKRNHLYQKIIERFLSKHIDYFRDVQLENAYKSKTNEFVVFFATKINKHIGE
jgi:hypothetical protein